MTQAVALGPMNFDCFAAFSWPWKQQHSVSIVSNITSKHYTHVQMNLPLVLPVVLSTMPVKYILPSTAGVRLTNKQAHQSNAFQLMVTVLPVGFGWDIPACHMAGIAGQLRMFGPWAFVC